MIEYHIIEHMSYDWLVVVYFFLGGMSAGSFIFSVIANYWKPEFKPFAKTAAILSSIFLAIGVLTILLDLGQIFRFWRLYATFVPTSVLSWGAWFLNIFLLLTVIYSYLLIVGKTDEAKKIAYIGFPFALATGMYTGGILTQMPGRILWHSPIIPVMFLLGGIISGSALVMLFSLGSDKRILLEKLGKIIGVLLIIELICMAVELFTLTNGGIEGVDMVKLLTIGNYSFLFWGVEIFAGALIPIFIFFRKQSTLALQASALILTLIGIFTMRYIIVIGGQVPTF